MKHYTSLCATLLASLALLLIGCGQRTESVSPVTPDTTQAPDIADGGEPSSAPPQRIRMETENKGISMVIDAEIPPLIHDPHIISIGNRDVMEELYQELIAPTWGNDVTRDVTCCTVTDAAGRPLVTLSSDLRYTDFEVHTLSPNGSYLEGLNAMRYSLFTEEMPGDIACTATEAAKLVEDFFTRHSVFTYTPRKILSGLDGKTGYYTVYLQAQYEGIPLFSVSADGRSVGVHANITNDGIVSFQGGFAFEETARHPVENPVSFESVLQTLTEKHHAIFPADITFHTITQEYLFYKMENGVYELRPGWCFYGISDSGIESDYAVCFSMEDGSYFWTVLS